MTLSTDFQMYPVVSKAVRLVSHVVAVPEGNIAVPPGQSFCVKGTMAPLVSNRRAPNTLKHIRPAPEYGVPLAFTAGATGFPRTSTAVYTRAVDEVGVAVFATP